MVMTKVERLILKKKRLKFRGNTTIYYFNCNYLPNNTTFYVYMRPQ